MKKKILDGIKLFLQESLCFFIGALIAFIILSIKVPYSIYTPGGLVNLEKRLSGDVIKSKGSLNMTYVSILEGNIPTYLLSKILPSWDAIKNEDIVMEGETIEIENKRGRIALYESISNAIYSAYTEAGITPITTSEKDYVYYVLEEAKTDLQVGDLILEVDGKKVTKSTDLPEFLASKKEGDKFTIKVKRGKKELDIKGETIKINGEVKIGFMAKNIKEYQNKPSIEYTYTSSEYGPSGGLMMSLAIYNALTEEDITKGYKISGTGTIKPDGTVGEIGGVKYKLSGAVKKKSKVFIVPEENYEEAMQLKKKNKYKIEIIKAKNFSDVVKALKELK